MTEMTHSSKGPQCPYCKYVHDSNDDAMWIYNEDLEDMSCESCGKQSEVDVITTYSWVCEPIDEEAA